MNSRVLIVGLGNEFRSDDGIGIRVASMLKELEGERVTVLEGSGDLLGMLELLTKDDTAIVIDAVQSGAAPGTIVRFDAQESAVPPDLFRRSTHQLGLTDAIGLSRELGRALPRIIVYGIEGAKFDPGSGLTPEVEDAASRVAAAIKEDISALAGR